MLDLIKRNINPKSGLILFIFASLFIFVNNNIKKNKPKDLSDYVVIVERGLLSERISSSGEIKASKAINISPRKQGFINSINVKEGDKVKKNQIIATIDDKDFVYKVEEYKLRAEKQKKDFLRREYLFKEGAISKETFEEFKNKFETSQAKLNDALSEKSFYTIRAPFAGEITAEYVEIGTYVAPSANFNSSNTTRNFIVELSSGLEIIAKVPESDIGRIKIGQEAIVRVEAFPSKKYFAVVDKIASRANKDNNVTSFEVTLLFKELSKDIKIGMTADLEFKVEDSLEKILVPTVSIVTEKGKKGILKVGKNSFPEFKEIEIGISSGNQTSVISGVNPGERIFLDIPPWSKNK
tara:strand:+ start:473 stop:1531 length:1059 start_codon:yes stop_codon:yes gene_type:complete